MWYEWFFDGLGTEIISLIIGLGLGIFGGYKVGIRKNALQKQISANDVKQSQRLEVKAMAEEKTKGGVDLSMRQVQKGKDNVEQVQVGKIE